MSLMGKMGHFVAKTGVKMGHPRQCSKRFLVRAGSTELGHDVPLGPWKL